MDTVLKPAGMMTNRIDEGMIRSQINIATLGFQLQFTTSGEKL